MAEIVDDWSEDLMEAARARDPNDPEDAFTPEEVEPRIMLAGWGYEIQDDGSMRPEAGRAMS